VAFFATVAWLRLRVATEAGCTGSAKGGAKVKVLLMLVQRVEVLPTLVQKVKFLLKMVQKVRFC
jgi:hypothetical protein